MDASNGIKSDACKEEGKVNGGNANNGTDKTERSTSQAEDAANGKNVKSKTKVSAGSKNPVKAKKVRYTFDEDDGNSSSDLNDTECEDDDSSVSDANTVTYSDIGSDDEGIDQLTSNGWKRWSPSDPQPTRHPFTVKNAGFQITGENVPSNELGFLQLFFSDELLNEIANETNRYAKEKLQVATLAKSSIWKKWRPVELVEMRVYFGLILNMAINDRPEIKDYFSQQWIDWMPFFSEVMTRERFLQIHWMLHVSPPASPELANTIMARGSKVDNVVKYVQKKCLENFIPGEKIAVDESTVNFSGRVAWKMHNPQKPTKWGLRVFALADSKTGYIGAFEPYYGRTTTDMLPRPEHSFTTRIVMHLADVLLEKADGSGYQLFTDRYYTNVILAQELLKKKIHLTGTIQKSRKGLPPQFRENMRMKPNDVVAFTFDRKMMALAWQDNRQVMMLSTYHDASITKVARKRRKQVVEVGKPVMIADYTKHMGAVDRADHYFASYGFVRKSLKWWRKLFFWLLEVAVVNSFILFNVHRQSIGKPAVRHIKYRKELVKQLIGEFRSPPKNRVSRPLVSHSNDYGERLNGKPHFIANLTGKRTKDCAVCSYRSAGGQRKKTIYYCKTCSGHPGLHPIECFEKYHTMKKYH